MQILKQILPRLTALTLIIVGILWNKYELFFLLSAGVLLGFYYGWFNDLIWRPNGKLESSLPYRAHQIWIHVISGIVGALAFYLLLGAINFSDRQSTLEKLNFSEFILFLISILGYTGLLPRILWFFTYAQHKFK